MHDHCHQRQRADAADPRPHAGDPGWRPANGMACQCGGGDRTAEARARGNAATVAGVTAGQSSWQRKRSEADRGSSLNARRNSHPETQSRRRVLGKLQRPLWGRYVDRIYKAVSNAPREVPWFWGLEFHEWQGSDGPQYGNVATLEAAKQTFRTVWDRRLKAHGRR